MATRPFLIADWYMNGSKGGVSRALYNLGILRSIISASSMADDFLLLPHQLGPARTAGAALSLGDHVAHTTPCLVGRGRCLPLPRPAWRSRPCALWQSPCQ
eukprot:6200450-Pleurochrysis_carterae.AAC.1